MSALKSLFSRGLLILILLSLALGACQPAAAPATASGTVLYNRFGAFKDLPSGALADVRVGEQPCHRGQSAAVPVRVRPDQIGGHDEV